MSSRCKVRLAHSYRMKMENLGEPRVSQNRSYHQVSLIRELMIDQYLYLGCGWEKERQRQREIERDTHCKQRQALRYIDLVKTCVCVLKHQHTNTCLHVG